MLVLTRRIGEELILPELAVRIKLLDAGSNRAKLGVTAPFSVEIVRGELYRASPPQPLECPSVDVTKE